MRNIFSQNVDFIENIIESNQLQDIIYISQGRLHHLNINMEKEEYYKFDLECKK